MKRRVGASGGGRTASEAAFGRSMRASGRKVSPTNTRSRPTPTQQAAPSVGPTKAVTRKREVRKAVSRGDFGRSFARLPRTERKESGGEPIRPSLLPRKEVVAAVIDALSQPVDLPGTKFDKLGEMLSFLAPGGVVKGATVKGVSGLRAAVPQREAAKRALARRASRGANRREATDWMRDRRNAARRRRRSRPASEKRAAREAVRERNEMRGWQRDEWNEAGPNQ